jgi:hypothetical protein
LNATNQKLPAGYVVCPSCGNIANPKKEPVCKYCNCDLLAEGSRRVTSRLSDGELLVRIQRYQTQGLCFLFTALPVMFAGIIVLVVSGNEEFTAVSAVGVSLITLGFLGIWRAIVVNNVATEMFKVNVVRDALAEVLEGCVYKSKLSISQPRIAATGLFEGWNRFSGEDYIRGAYQGHEIEFSDIVLENEHTEGTGDRKRTVKTTVFQGPWLTCRLRKKLPAKVVLREGGGKGNVETESVAFNSKYQLLTDDPHTLFRVLTPHFMEYVVAADEELNARTFFCFAGDRVHIAVYNKHNAFEIPANSNAGNLDAAREQIKKEMRSITGILDVLLRNEFLL